MIRILDFCGADTTLAVSESEEIRKAAGVKELTALGIPEKSALLLQLMRDISVRCAAETAESAEITINSLALLFRCALESKTEPSMFIAGIPAKGPPELRLLFSGRRPIKSAVLNAVSAFLNGGKYTRWAIAHSFTETSPGEAAVFANELYQLSAGMGLQMEDYLVIHGVDCRSMREPYKKFW